MFCSKCETEVNPVKDMWGNERCPTCQSLAKSTNAESDAGADDKKDKSIAPNYQEFLKKKNKFDGRKKKGSRKKNP